MTHQDTLLEVLVALQHTDQLRGVDIDTLGETTTITWTGTAMTTIGADGALTATHAEYALTVDADGTVT